jgi:enamine deaminase RidA (YjgF/YER057c/UK114 family)
MANVSITTSERNGRKCASSGSKWEPIIGYSRAIRTGNVITVCGTVGVNADGTYPPTMGEQTKRALAIIQAAIEALGGTLRHVVRTRMFVTDIAQWEAVGRAHGELFADIRPATTMVEVTKLIDAAALVEIEADAIVG